MAEIDIPKPNVNVNMPESSLIRDRNQLGSQKKDAPDPNMKPLKGGITKKEPSFGEKLKRSFVKDDARNIRDYIVFDIIIPSLRKSVFDTIVGTAAQIFGISVPRSIGYFGDGRYNGNERLTPHERQFRDYNSISSRPRTGIGTLPSERYDRFYVSDYPFTYKEDADEVLMRMMDICDSYGWVSVSKFFEIADPNGTVEGKNPYTNNNYGWTDITGSVVKYIQDYGYIITLPPARPRRR